MRTSLRYLQLILLTCGIVIAASALTAGVPTIGSPAPGFTIESGGDEIVKGELLRGKVVVIFYETRDVSDRSNALKDYLDAFNDRQPEAVKKSIVWLPIIDCSGVFWPLTAIWKSKMRERSKKEQITIYGDWSGDMGKRFGMRKEDNNFVILDRNGVIRFFASGVVEQKKFPDISRLLLQLAAVP